MKIEIKNDDNETIYLYDRVGDNPYYNCFSDDNITNIESETIRAFLVKSLVRFTKSDIYSTKRSRVSTFCIT